MPTGIHGNPSPPAVMLRPDFTAVGTTRVVAVGSVAASVVVGWMDDAVVGEVVVCAAAPGTATTSTPSASSPKAMPRRTGDTVVGPAEKGHE